MPRSWDILSGGRIWDISVIPSSHPTPPQKKFCSFMDNIIKQGKVLNIFNVSIQSYKSNTHLLSVHYMLGTLLDALYNHINNPHNYLMSKVIIFN